MSKVRVYELAKDLKVESKDLISRAAEIGIEAQNHMTVLDQDEAARIKRLFLQPRDGEVVETRVAKTVVRRRRLATEDEVAQPTVRVSSTVVRRSRPVEAPAPEPEHYEEAAPAPEPVEVTAEVAEAPSAPEVFEQPVYETAEAEAAPVERAAEPVAEVAPQPEPQAPPAPEPPAPEPVQPVTRPTPAPVPEVVAEVRRPSLLRIDPDGRPTDRQAVVVAPPPPGFQAPRPPGQRAPFRPGGPPPRGPARGPGPGQQPFEPRFPAPGAPPAGVAAAGPAPAGAGPAGPRRGVAQTEEDRRNAAKKPKGKQVFDRRGGAFNLRAAVELDDIGGRGGRRGKRFGKPKKAQKTQLTTPKAIKRVIKIESSISVQELAAAMSVKSSDIIRQLMQGGVMATVTQTLDFETAEMIASEAGFTCENVAFDIDKMVPDRDDTDEELLPRPPVVTVMGHVDHGKTSLLDRIRKAHVADGEAGGITQHIGAYSVELDTGTIVFLDTPGHEAFTAMRARGAQVTDIVILVVAADDGVMPQTLEAIAHAREADVPIIVAVNKIDKNNARPDRVLQELAAQGLQAEEWGGDTTIVKVSAHTGEGIEQLLEMVLLQADVLELTANPNKPARGVVIESQLDKGRGPVASVLVQEGTLRVGDTVVTGTSFGRVRALMDDKGNSVKEAGPSTAVEVLGLDSTPIASDAFYGVEDDKRARQIVEHRIQAERKKSMGATSKVSLDALYKQIQEGEVQELKIILKADVHGSSEAIKKALTDIKHDQVKVRIILDGVGAITESDVNFASASNAIIIGFNVRPETSAKALAEQERVDIKLYTIIYDAIDDVKKGMEGLLAPTQEERALGQAEVRETFSVPKMGVIAGSYVTQGLVRRGALARLLRDNVQVWKGKVGSLRRFKDDVREVREGYECGLGLENYNDIKVGDIIEVYEIIEVSQTLE